MNLTLKNQQPGTRSYLGGVITVADSSQTTISRELNVPIAGDAQFIFDVLNSVIIINNGVNDLNPGRGFDLINFLAQFTNDPLATLFLYYDLPINLRQSAATAANTTVWSMRNDPSSTRLVIIERIYLMMSFDAGTPLGRSLLRYEILKFNTATPTGGTSITPVAMDTLGPSTSITDARFANTGLSVTSVVFDNPIAIVSCPASDGSTAQFTRDLPILLRAGEGLAIRLNVAAVVGQGLCGEINWSER